jgi:hypothetical protein
MSNPQATPDSLRLRVQIPHFQRVLLDEFAAGFDFVAHEDAEHVGGAEVLHGDFHQSAIGKDRGRPAGCKLACAWAERY